MGAFGSFGWGGGAVKDAYEAIKKVGVETMEPGVQVQYRPSAQDENKCYEFGKAFAQKVKEYDKKFKPRTRALECKA